jgi:hypothetical protein
VRLRLIIDVTVPDDEMAAKHPGKDGMTIAREATKRANESVAELLAEAGRSPNITAHALVTFLGP